MDKMKNEKLCVVADNPLKSKVCKKLTRYVENLFCHICNKFYLCKRFPRDMERVGECCNLLWLRTYPF